jgi:hypothetical protein
MRDEQTDDELQALPFDAEAKSMAVTDGLTRALATLDEVRQHKRLGDLDVDLDALRRDIEDTRRMSVRREAYLEGYDDGYRDGRRRR